jgi:hypothetical protein
VLALTTVGIVAPASPGGAVTNGELDGAAHPNVACVIGQRSDGSFVGCGTGQLIAPNVVLVAAHEFPVLEGQGATRFFVSFEPAVDFASSKLFPAASIEVAPSFNPVSFEGLDLAVLVLSKPVRRVSPIELPAEGVLDELKAAGSLGDQPFVVVGYGVDCVGVSPAQCVPAFDTVRRAAPEAVVSVHADEFTVQANAEATGLGAPCFGDSGSPHFLGDSDVSVGVTGWIAGACNDATRVTRLDTAAARAFLGRFVALP